MAGSVFYRKDRNRWCVSWPKPSGESGSYTVSKYKGELMYDRRIAQKCLSMIQGRWEQSQQGLCQFRIEEFTGKGFTDVLAVFEEWMKEVVEKKRKPGTISTYWSAYNQWIKPFFTKYPLMLNEVRYSSLNKFRNFIEASEVRKLQVLTILHSMFKYAKKAELIQAIPTFPEKAEYEIVEKAVKWLTTEQQMAIINAIPEIHQPIFLWLKYHYRRPNEAMALQKLDYNHFQDVFTIHMGISDGKLVESLKTNTEHVIPCHPDFRPLIKSLLRTEGKFMFVNPRALTKDKRYEHRAMRSIWNRACEKVGIKSKLYAGLKHSSCSQAVNEQGMNLYEVQMLTQHAKLESVKKYTKVEIGKVRELMQRGRVVDFNSRPNTGQKTDVINN